MSLHAVAFNWLSSCEQHVCCLHAGIQGVLDAYRYALTNVKLWGPTNAAPIINHVARFAEQADRNPEAQVSGDAACICACYWVHAWCYRRLLLCVLALELLYPVDVD